MKANELMVGDWVDFYHPYEPEKKIVTRHRVTEIYECGLVGISNHPNPVHADHIELIYLTSEILKLNGFEAKGERLRSLEFDLEINPNTDDEHWVFVRLHPKNKNCSYMWAYIVFQPTSLIDMNTIETKIVDCSVHQFQHALRLCGLNDLADNFKVTEGGEK